MESLTREGHFYTFLEMRKMVSFATSNEDKTSELGNCKICPAWKFSSNAEQDRHRKLFHYYAKTSDVCKDRKCKCNHKVDGNICGEVFPSQHKRNRIEKAKQDVNFLVPKTLLRNKNF